MSESLGQPAWITAPATRAVIAALEAVGGAGCARFVGGCVRNALVGRKVDDIDIATRLKPQAVIEALRAAGLKAVPTGLAHGTITGVSEGRPYEITTLRRDVETDGRHATVAFTEDWVQDAGRRDFRLNALYADPDGTIFDPTGQGVADARAGRIVFVGDARTRIEEDYLRILRFFRFTAWFGKGEPDANALAAVTALKGGVKGLAAERISKEFLKLLAADDPTPAVLLMHQAGVLDLILPYPPLVERFERLVAIETEQLLENDPELRLAALIPSQPAAATLTAQRLRLPNALRDRLVAAAGEEPRIVSWLSPRETRRAVYRLGANAFCDRVKLAWAGSERPGAHFQWRALLPLARTWDPPALPLTGTDVVKAGVPAGPLVGEVLREVEAWWIDHDFIDDKLSAVEKLKAVAQGLAY